MRLDIHIHSSYSNDGSATPKDILRQAKKIGLLGIAVTDHNDITGSLGLWKENRNSSDFVVIPGVEVSSARGHILALGIMETVPRDLGPNETVERIGELGGVAVAVHPYRFWSGLGEEAVRAADFKIIEVLNSRSLKKENNRAKKLAEELGCGLTGGSDAHSLDQVGRAVTELDISSFDMDDVLEEFRRKRTRAQGKDRRRTSTVGYVASCLYLWMKRGMKRI